MKSIYFRRFDALVKKVLAVPREEIQRRLQRHRERADANPKKRGPKPKDVTPSASRRAEEKP
jgi:hypothetical protein